MDTLKDNLNEMCYGLLEMGPLMVSDATAPVDSVCRPRMNTTEESVVILNEAPAPPTM